MNCLSVAQTIFIYGSSIRSTKLKDIQEAPFHSVLCFYRDMLLIGFSAIFFYSVRLYIYIYTWTLYIHIYILQITCEIESHIGVCLPLVPVLGTLCPKFRNKLL